MIAGLDVATWVHIRSTTSPVLWFLMSFHHCLVVIEDVRFQAVYLSLVFMTFSVLQSSRLSAYELLYSSAIISLSLMSYAFLAVLYACVLSDPLLLRRICVVIHVQVSSFFCITIVFLSTLLSEMWYLIRLVGFM